MCFRFNCSQFLRISSAASVKPLKTLKKKAGIGVLRFRIASETVSKATLWHILGAIGAIRVSQLNSG
jgi:hypothetical protein